MQWCNEYNETKGAFLLVECAKASFWLVGFVVMEPLAYPAHPAFFFEVRNSVCWLSELTTTKKKRQKFYQNASSNEFIWYPNEVEMLIDNDEIAEDDDDGDDSDDEITSWCH